MGSEKKFCSECGTPLTPGASFCINCGNKIVADEPATKPEADVNATAEQEAFFAEKSEPVSQPTPVYEAPKYEKAVVEDTTVYANNSNASSGNHGISVGIAILMVAIGVIVSVAATLLLVKYSGLATTEKVICGETDDDETEDVSDEDVNVGGKTISTGDNVTINLDGDTESAAAAVYAKCEKSVVGIRIMYESSGLPWQKSSLQTYSEGSGVVFSEDGKIITNCHVVADALDSNGNQRGNFYIRVYLDKSLTTYYDAKVLGVDESTDLALIQIDQTGLTPIEFADADTVTTGITVFSLGSPGGLEFMNSICQGIISGLNRDLTTESGYAYDLIQTTAAINPGNSGGALLNSEGQLVGICSMKIASSEYDDMGFAISVKTVKSIIESIEKNGKVVRPMLGISVASNYTAEVAAENNLPAGVWVYTVETDGPADQAGIQVGMIITKIGDDEITCYNDLKTALAKHEVGETVAVTAYNTKTESSAIYKVTLTSSN